MASATGQRGMRTDVEALAELDRRTTTDGERRSAEWIRRRLVDVGAADVRIRSFRSQSSWTPVHVAYVAAAAIVSLIPGRWARSAALGIVGSYEAEVSGRNQWARRLLPARSGKSVTARIPSRGPSHRTLVLIAHHDAAQGGFVWHPSAVGASRRRSRRTGKAIPSHAPVLAAMLLAAAPSRLLRRIATALLGLSGALFAQSARSPTAPGANDNATGVATVLELARRLTAEPLPDTDVHLVFPGGEEVGNTGMRQWLREDRSRLDPDRTLVLNIDAVGSGGHLVVPGREGLTATYDRTDIALAHRAARTIGVDLRTVGFPNVTDGFITRNAGFRTLSLLSHDDGWVSNLHRPTDIADNVRWNTVQDAVALAERIAHDWRDGEGHHAGGSA